jgi:ribonuclease HII
MLELGIDDAGRGPIIGPMVLSGVLLDKNSKKALENKGIADSKTLQHSTRMNLSKLIQESALAFHTVMSSPKEIDKAIFDKINLNTLEAMKTAEIINEINSGIFKKEKIKVIVDCPSINTIKWRQTLMGFIENPKNLQVICEHKADANHLSVAAASILSKVKREEEVSKLKSQYGDLGSGYPSDPATKEFLKSSGEKLSNSGIFRKSWQTWKNLFPQDLPQDEKSKQQRLF